MNINQSAYFLGLLFCGLTLSVCEGSRANWEDQPNQRENGDAPALVVKQKYRFARGLSIGGKVAFSPDGKLLVGSEKGALIVWEVSSGQEKKRIACDPSASNVAFLSDSRRLAWMQGEFSPGKSVRVWDLISDQETNSIALARGESFFGFLPDGKRFITNNAGVVQIKQGDKADVVREFRIVPKNRGGINSVSTDGKILSSIESLEKKIKIWRIESGEEIVALTEERLGGTALSSDGKWIAGSNADTKTVGIWDAKSGAKIHKASLPDKSIKRVFSPDDRLLAIGSVGTKSRISIRDTKTFEELVSWETDPSNSESIAFGPNGNLIAATGGRSFQVWEITSQNGKGR